MRGTRIGNLHAREALPQYGRQPFLYKCINASHTLIGHRPVILAMTGFLMSQRTLYTALRLMSHILSPPALLVFCLFSSQLCLLAHTLSVFNVMTFLSSEDGQICWNHSLNQRDDACQREARSKKSVASLRGWARKSVGLDTTRPTQNSPRAIQCIADCGLAGPVRSPAQQPPKNDRARRQLARNAPWRSHCHSRRVQLNSNRVQA